MLLETNLPNAVLGCGWRIRLKETRRYHERGTEAMPIVSYRFVLAVGHGYNYENCVADVYP
jgi:hypothetical protein